MVQRPHVGGVVVNWDELLTQRRENVRTSYKARPQRLGADHNEERQKAGDYAGRELLEMLQNAGTQRERQRERRAAADARFSA